MVERFRYSGWDLAIEDIVTEHNRSEIEVTITVAPTEYATEEGA
jgi:hypothetical protein